MTSLSTYTFYNPYPAGSVQSQAHWANYVHDATIANYQVDALGSFVEQASREQIQAIDAASRRVSGELAAVADGIQALAWEQATTNRHLAEVNDSLQRIDQRLSLLVEEQRIGTMPQENIAQLLRIPDSQKQRQHHLELGLKFFKNARKASDLYQDALKELLSAETCYPAITSCCTGSGCCTFMPLQCWTSPRPPNTSPKRVNTPPWRATRKPSGWGFSRPDVVSPSISKCCKPPSKGNTLPAKAGTPYPVTSALTRSPMKYPDCRLVAEVRDSAA